MKAGFSKICINPPLGFPIVGYYQERRVKGYLDDLFVRAVVFDDGENKATVIAVDICLLSQTFCDRFRKAIEEKTGIDAEAVFINASHTHTGPLLGKDFATNTTSTKEYEDFLCNSIVRAVEEAIVDLRDCTAETGETEAKGISFVRRYRMKDGSVATNPGVKNPNIDHVLDSPNETVKLIKIMRDGADDIFMVNFGTHPDSVGGEYISADYMGHLCKIIENAVPNTKCMFLLGPQGDVNHVNVAPTFGESRISTIDFDSVPRSQKHSEHMGRVLAGAVLSICSITEPVELDKIAFKQKHVKLPSHQENDKLEEAKYIYSMYQQGRQDELPYKEMFLTTAVATAKRIVMLENGPDSFPFLLSAIKVGDLVFAGVGGEPFSEIGRRIYKNSPFKGTILCCLTNNSSGYIPTTKAYSEGGYEAGTSTLRPGSDDILVNEMDALLKSL